MATSPIVLANASTSASPSTAIQAPAAKFPIVTLLIAVVAGVFLAVAGIGGAAYYLVRSGRLPILGPTVKTEPVVPADTRLMVLDPLLVNLADAGGGAYLRTSLTLRVSDVVDPKELKPKEEKTKANKNENDAVAAVRDTALSVLGRQTADALLAVDGKERLKTELKAAMVEHNAGLKIRDVYFTDFLVQR